VLYRSLTGRSETDENKLRKLDPKRTDGNRKGRSLTRLPSAYPFRTERPMASAHTAQKCLVVIVDRIRQSRMGL